MPGDAPHTPGRLFVVSTPIGNLEDITLRALRVLREADLIAAEDTRHTRKLLAHFDIHTPLTGFYQHRQFRQAPELVSRMLDGANLALVTDAGTPGISDPGAVLVRLAIEAGLEVTPVPVNHVVPTTGLLLRQNGSSLLFTSDTGPTERVWEVANAADDLSAVITECSFPNRLQAVADASLHLTPQTLAGELAKLTRAVTVYLYHFKPPYLEELRAEVASAALPHPVTELVQDRVYRF